jgi:hypothetical protein
MSGTLYFVDMNERSEYENGSQKRGERAGERKKKKIYNMYIYRTKE